MDRIYRYNLDASYKPNGGTYLQIISAKDLYIQNITVAENDGHSDSFQVNDLTKWRNRKYFSTWQSRGWETNKPGMSYINENSFSRWIIEKSDSLTMLGLQKLSESVRDYAYLILMSQTSMRGPIVGIESRNIDAQRTFLNTFENIVNRRVNIPEDIRRFQKTLQYARSKVDYAIGEFIYMLPSDMNLWNGNVRNYNNKILILSPSFKIGTNAKINLDVKSKEVEMVKTKPDVKSKVKTKPDVKSNKEHKQDVKPNIELKHDVKVIRTKPDTNKITYEDEKVALILGTTAVFTVWWVFK